MSVTTSPNVASLGNWIHSWVHTNPYRIGDMTAGHTTWASPFLAGLAQAISQRPDARAQSLLERLIDFQSTSFHPDGQYSHIGFNVGEICQKGLIHNALPNCSLGLTALYGRDWLPSQFLEQIRSAMLRNLNVGCMQYGSEGRPDESAVCNQDYARIWAKLLFMLAFDDRPWLDEVREDIDHMIEHFHITGMPDDDSAGTLRVRGIKDILEPSEYYGLMIR